MRAAFPSLFPHPRRLLIPSDPLRSFHRYFRSSFQQLFELSDGSFEKNGLSVPDFMDVAESFLRHLEGHHGIEERYIFPVLAKKMPQFAEEHQEEHDTIHEGMHQLEVCPFLRLFHLFFRSASPT